MSASNADGRVLQRCGAGVLRGVIRKQGALSEWTVHAGVATRHGARVLKASPSHYAADT